MPTVDRWVVHRACELLGAHSAAVGEDIARFAINLSGQSLQDDSFLEYVVDEIRTQQAAAQRAVLRIDRDRDDRQSREGAALSCAPCRISAASSRSMISEPA